MVIIPPAKLNCLILPLICPIARLSASVSCALSMHTEKRNHGRFMRFSHAARNCFVLPKGIGGKPPQIARRFLLRTHPLLRMAAVPFGKTPCNFHPHVERAPIPLVRHSTCTTRSGAAPLKRQVRKRLPLCEGHPPFA